MDLYFRRPLPMTGYLLPYLTGANLSFCGNLPRVLGANSKPLNAANWLVREWSSTKRGIQ